MAYTLKLDEGFVCPSIAALRTTPNDKNKTAFLMPSYNWRALFCPK